MMYKMFKISAETSAKHSVHTKKVNKTDNKSVIWIKWLISKKELEVKNIHYLIDKKVKDKFKTNNPMDDQIKKYKRHGSELLDDEKLVYVQEGIIIPVIMQCKTPESCKFKRSLGLKLHDVVNCKEQTVLDSIKDVFEGEKNANSIHV